MGYLPLNKQQLEKEYPLGYLITKVIVGIARILLFSVIIFISWNAVIPHIGGFKLDNYLEAVALFILSRFLLNDTIISRDPITVHCDCMVPEGEPDFSVSVEEK